MFSILAICVLKMKLKNKKLKLLFFPLITYAVSFLTYLRAASTGGHSEKRLLKNSHYYILHADRPEGASGAAKKNVISHRCSTHEQLCLLYNETKGEIQLKNHTYSIHTLFEVKSDKTMVLSCTIWLYYRFLDSLFLLIHLDA